MTDTPLALDLSSIISRDLRDFDTASNRSQQSREGILGPSDIGFCRQKAVLVTRGVDPTDEKKMWAAQVGTAIHNYVEAALKVMHPDWLMGSIDQLHVTATLPSGAEIGGHPDIVIPELNTIIDIKTTSKPLEEWERSAWTYGYPFQAGWYRKAFGYATGERLGFGFVVTETVAPWRTAYFMPTPRWLAKGDALAADAIGLISRCTATGDWSDVRTGRTLDVPGWMQDSDE